MTSFASRIIDWQRRHGRHDLPWQAGRDPYRIWLSEIMLQQTQVATVVPYFKRFVARFPDVATLAAAHEDEVLALWSGLGYYSRARNLLAAARIVMALHGGRLPDTPAAIAQLPGIGRSTAAAISAFAFGVHGAILEGNVKRVLARHAGILGWAGERKVETALWHAAESRLPDTGIEAYTQGMMDLGALICTRGHPACDTCPVRQDCVALQQGRVHELPTPRPRRTLPEKRVQMLLLLDRGEVMLEKRAPQGVWGGLWSLPEAPPDADAAALCRERYGFVAQSRLALPILQHSFTHFRLHIEPVQLQLAPRTVAAPGQVWLTPTDALDAPLPAPVRSLVTRIRHA
ncbi:MAG TPA: A/G-specific adenine glycosylase [Thiobacillaceae bacterium]|nr:A/G-specific adenine glycosylase [Thiobacillaceae bacterium]